MAAEQSRVLLHTVLGWIVAVVSICVIILTLASTIPSNQWWIRMWDFPRLIILTTGGIAFIALLFVRYRWRWILIVALGAAVLYQLYRIYPFTFIAPVEAEKIEISSAERDEHCFSVMSLNVLQTNRQFDRTIEAVREANPDMLLLMETDERWAEALEPLLTEYPNRFNAPLSNKYGMLFATRLPVESGEIINLVGTQTPSVHGVARTPAGYRFSFTALHPRPPHPNHDTEERDAELAVAARRIRDLDMPSISFGDFNDVGWSDTSLLFSRTARFVDPRIGRGFYATFPASWPGFRWPLDHLFFTEHFALYSLSTGDPVGSDHLPIHAEVCRMPEAGERLNQINEMGSEDVEDFEEIMTSYREDKIEERSNDR